MIAYEEILSAGSVLRGMVHRPDSPSKMPLVLMLHGYTGSKQEIHWMFVKFARMLEQNGMACARFDFSGSGDSDGEFCRMTFEKELAEARDMLSHMLQKEYVDPERVMLLGQSMGGAVAGVLAAQFPWRIKKVCLWAPAGNLREAIHRTIRNNTGLDALEGGKDIDNKGHLTGRAFLKELDTIDIFAMSRGYAGEVLLVRGDRDDIVTEDTCGCYRDIYGGRVRLHTVAGAGHTFDAESFEQEVFTDSLHFLMRED